MKDDFHLLEMMLSDSKSQSPLYQPGPYWAAKAKHSANEIKRCGIADFRGSTNLIGLSYADGVHIDVRDLYRHGLRRILRWLTTTYPLNKIYDAQVQWTKGWAEKSMDQLQEILNTNEKVRNLIKKYTLPYSLLGECRRKVAIDGHEYSAHYLDLLEQHDNIASQIKYQDAYSVFEIGGGFGINIHLLLENYKNIRKVLYLDIPPNLYVGTQYLKAFFGAAVSDYKSLRHLDSMEFSADDTREILCIAPWQIEKFRGKIDIFMNSHSFVEMPKDVVKNYADRFSGFMDSKDSAIALTTYDGFNLKTTFDPTELPKFFNNRKFDYFEADSLPASSRKNFFFVSPGKFSFKSIG